MYEADERGYTLTKKREPSTITVVITKEAIEGRGRFYFRLRLHNLLTDSSVSRYDRDIDIGIAPAEYPFEQCWLRDDRPTYVSQGDLRPNCKIELFVDIDTDEVHIEVTDAGGEVIARKSGALVRARVVDLRRTLDFSCSYVSNTLFIVCRNPSQRKRICVLQCDLLSAP